MTNISEVFTVVQKYICFNPKPILFCKDVGYIEQLFA